MARSRHHRKPYHNTQGGGAAPIEYLLRIEFNGAWTPGSGTYTEGDHSITVVDSGSHTSIVAGKFTHTNLVGSGDPSFYSASIARAQGLTLLIGNVNTPNRSFLRWTNTLRNSNELMAEPEGIGQVIVGSHGIAGVLSTSPSIDYDVALTLDTAGGFVYLRAAGSGDFKLKWHDSIGTTTPVVPQYLEGGTAGSRTIDSWSIVQDSNTVLINPDINEATPVSATVYAGTSSAIIDMSVTAPGTLANQTELRFRVQDTLNYYTAYFDSAGAFKLDRVIAGTPTNLVNVAAVMAAGGTRRIRVRADGNNIDCWTKSGTTWTKRGATITSALLVAYSDVIPVVGAGWTVANLRSDKVFDAVITTLLEAWLAGN